MIMERKLKLFGHIPMMNDNQLMKNVVFRIIDGLNRRGRPSRESMDDIKEWCQTDVQTLGIIAQDRSEWKRVVMETLVTNGRKPMEEERGRPADPETNTLTTRPRPLYL